jgi:hypothetical protein
MTHSLHRGAFPALVLSLAFSAVATLSACSSSDDSFPRIANPPNFDFADGDELRSGMHQLAFELQKLDMSLLTADDSNPVFQQGVVTSLNNIERIAGRLRSGDISARHPFLRDDMDRFLSNVRRAREEAARSAPRYYMAGRVSGGCVSCHRANE